MNTDLSRAGLYPTVWPSEATDLWRSHTVIDAGLPAEAFTGPTPPTLQVETASLNLPMWGCTRAKDEVLVYCGSPFLMDFYTQSIKTSGKVMSTGSLEPGLLMNFLEAHPYIAKVNPLSMAVTKCELSLGSTINYNGGLVMHANGYVYAVARAVLYQIDAATMKVMRSRHLPLIGDTDAEKYETIYNGIMVTGSGDLVLKGTGFKNYATTEGVLLLCDPDTLEIKVQTSAIVSPSRLTIQQTEAGAVWVYLVNECETARFRITDSAFELDPSWSRTYRQANSGSTQASSPLLFGKIGQIVFADNTSPHESTPFMLYTQPVAQAPSAGPLKPVPAFATQLAGFNFCMVAGDPFVRQVVVYFDPINDLLSAHTVGADGNLIRLWEAPQYKVSASPAIVTDRDLLYIDNYQAGVDHFVVLRLSTGEELASVPLAATLPTIGGIIVGGNEDVFITSTEAGTTNGLISRITVVPSAI